MKNEKIFESSFFSSGKKFVDDFFEPGHHGCRSVRAQKGVQHFSAERRGARSQLLSDRKM